MNPTNPFETKNAAQAQLQKSRARLKFAVVGALGACVVVASLMMLQGCKREEPVSDLPPVDTNTTLTADTNFPVMGATPSNLVSIPAINIPGYTNSAPVAGGTVTAPPIAAGGPITPVETAITAPPAAGGEYTVAKGDSFFTIAKNHHVSMKAIQDANPGVDSKHLKVGQKLSLPAASTATATTAEPVATSTGSATYTVKSGDTLMKIAKSHGTTYKAIKAANGLSTDRIKVGQKLKIPTKEVAAPVVTTPVVETAPPAVQPVTIPTLPPAR